MDTAMMAERSDEEVLARVASGENVAVGLLYDRYGTSIYSLALRMVQDPSAAEEIVQETFVRVWRQAASYQRVRGAPATWMLGITRNLAIDELRRRGARPQPVGNDPDVELALIQSGEADPAEQAYANMRHDIVSDALARLPPAQREVLELAYFGGLSQSEIATRLGDPLGTVKTRIRLGLQKLKSIINPDAAEVETL